MKKINIVELLKNCPRGMELDCVMFNDVTLWEVEEDAQFPISIKVGIDDIYLLTEYGEWNDINAKCVIFPKGKDTWEGFTPPCSEFKEGDVVTYKYEQGLVSMILRKFVNFVEVHFHCALYNNAKGLIADNYIIGEPRYVYHATEEEKEKLFKEIEKNGYRWNFHAKKLEKLIKPKFKVGDKIKLKNSPSNIISTVTKINDDGSICVNDYTWAIRHELQYKYELVPNKFDITTLKPYKSEVLYRNSPGGYWKPAFWGAYIPENSEQHSNHNFLTTDGFARYCIPFEGNEHLIGTQTDCSEYYKIWED